MRARVCLMLSLLLASCGDEAPEPETVDEFAARVGTVTPDAGTAAEDAAPTPQATAQPAPTQAAQAPANAAPAATQGSVLQLETLGDVSEIGLGPRAGGCTFSSGGNAMLVAAGPSDRALPGKATLRAGGKLRILDAPPGGYNAIKSGTLFRGEGFTALVTLSGADSAKLTMRNAGGQQSVFDGRWVCA